MRRVDRQPLTLALVLPGVQCNVGVVSPRPTKLMHRERGEGRDGTRITVGSKGGVARVLSLKMSFKSFKISVLVVDHKRSDL